MFKMTQKLFAKTTREQNTLKGEQFVSISKPLMQFKKQFKESVLLVFVEI